MLTLVLRRALAQRRLLVGVVALVTLGTTLLGVGALLLGTTQDRAFTAGARELLPPDVDVSAFLVGLDASDAVSARDDARSVVGDALSPMRPTLTSNTVSRMRRLADGQRLGYLVSTDALGRRAALTSGRWVEAPGEAVLPQTTADRLHLAPGDRITLGREIGTDPASHRVTLVVVGTFRPTSRSGWEGDPLTGSGYDAAYSDGQLPTPVPAFGPFVVDDATFLASRSSVDSVEVTGHPSLDHVTEASMAKAADGVRSADGLLSARVGDVAQISRVTSDLPDTLTRVREQQAATRSTVLVVLLLVTTLALTALLLAGRLLDGVRETERALLVGLGLGRGQLALATLTETLLVATAATVIAVPSAALAHSAVTQLPAMQTAGLGQGLTVTAGLVLTEIAGAVLLALALAVPVLGPAVPRNRVATAARSGVDLLLVVVAVAAWWQLHAQPSDVATGDTIRTLAPIICVAAATAVAVRLVPPLLALVALVAARSTALVLPLASSQAARRPYAGAALVLLVMGAASAILGVSLQATWERSQGDQAALRVGTDLAVELSTSATDREAAAIAAATHGLVASPVTARPLALGRYVGAAGAVPRLVAIDARRAGALLRGRLDHGRTWSGVGDLLAPGPSLAGLRLSSGGVSILGTVPTGVSAEVTATIVVQDASGFRSTVSADAVPLDGRSHRLRGLSRVEGMRLVAAKLTLSERLGSRTRGTATVSVALSVTRSGPGSGVRPGTAPDWDVRTLDAGQSPVAGSAVAVERSASRTTVRTTAEVDLESLSYSEGDVLATGFKAPAALPVAVSQQLADRLGVKVGGALSVTVAGVNVPVLVAAIVPNVPSEPGSVAVLADSDLLSRMLLRGGHLDPVVDAWWVADPAPGTAHALAGLDLGDVTTRTGVAAQLRQGPLRASVPAALTLLVIAAALLLLAGAALAIGADRPARSIEVARLRALGVTRAEATRLVLIEHGILLGLLVLTGAVVGAAASLTLGPSLIRSDIGTAPVPAALFVWPWLGIVAVVAGVLGGCLVIAAVITFAAVRRSGPAQLRAEDW